MAIGREAIYNKLKTITPNVYFNKGDETLNLSYPCIVYTLTRPTKRQANGKPYIINDGYVATYISKSTESKIRDFLFTFSNCSNDNVFISNGVYHEVFTIYDN